MIAERRKLARLRRLERLRDIAKQSAAAEVARAEAILNQQELLAERTRALAEGYANLAGARDGAELRLLGHFSGVLRTIQVSTEADVVCSRNSADRKQGELAQAERRRAVVADRAELAVLALARLRAARGHAATGAARKPLGTDLD